MEEEAMSGIRRRGERQQAWRTQELACGIPGAFHPPKGDLSSFGFALPRDIGELPTGTMWDYYK